jgi:hypothetical protein
VNEPSRLSPAAAATITDQGETGGVLGLSFRGAPKGASPESIITGRNYGFRAPSLRSGPGMTSSTVRVIVKSGAPVGAPLAAPAER